LILLAMIVGCFCTQAAAQEEDPRGRYARTGERHSLTVFGSLPRYNGNPSMLDGLGKKTAGELGLAGKTYWNEYPTYAEKVILHASAIVRYDSANPTIALYLDDCRWYNKKKKAWVYHPNRLKEISTPAVPIAPQVTTTTLAVTKAVSSPSAQVNVPVQYTITVTNTGTVPAKGVRVADTIASVAGVIIDPIMSISRGTSGTLTGLTLNEDLPPGGVLTITYRASITAAGMSVPNVVTVYAQNAPLVYAQALVATAAALPPARPACPDVEIETWATLKEKLLGGKMSFFLSIGTAVAISGAASSDGQRGKAMRNAAISTTLANRVVNFLNPTHNRAKVTINGNEVIVKRGEDSQSLPVGNGLNATIDWDGRRIQVIIPECGVWSASPNSPFNFTPVPWIYRTKTITQTTVVQPPVKTDPGKKKAPN
jgi:uncharacterized repeat protein (TIGR01451 family)